MDGDHQRAPPAERARVLHVQAIDALPCGRAPERQRDAQIPAPWLTPTTRERGRGANPR
jgi:hypothetical protein